MTTIEIGPPMPQFQNGPPTRQPYSRPGWQTMAKTVRDVDEEKIRDCKEDIDTLLVFAGLYSAVLTAFLIESYQSLQPDTGSEIVFLLRQSLAQNYSINGNFYNSTLPYPPSPTFEAPLWALRVNGLWFASLVCSLATASIGMFVKQWLREYLAIEWISPRERLRARQYRTPALANWKVIEIAAALPLLLHLSLALFFIGLCFFTAAVDERIGNSTLPLIASWGFFIVLTIFAPLISPRCPFKIPLLKSVMQTARKRLVRPLCDQLRFRLHEEESEMIKEVQDDLDVLLSVDEVMGSDDGLITIIWDVLKPSNPSPEVVVNFVLGMVKHRVVTIEENKAQHVETDDLRTLSRMAWSTIMDIVGLTLQDRRTMDLDEKRKASWILNTIHILLSCESRRPLPESVLSILFDDAIISDLLQAMSQSEIHPSAAVRFLVMVLEVRFAIDFNTIIKEGFSALPGGTGFYVSKAIWNGILEVISHVLQSHSSAMAELQNHRWATTIVHILLSDCPYAVPPSIPDLIADEANLLDLLMAAECLPLTWVQRVEFFSRLFRLQRGSSPLTNERPLFNNTTIGAHAGDYTPPITAWNVTVRIAANALEHNSREMLLPENHLWASIVIRLLLSNPPYPFQNSVHSSLRNDAVLFSLRNGAVLSSLRNDAVLRDVLKCLVIMDLGREEVLNFVLRIIRVRMDSYPYDSHHAPWAINSGELQLVRRLSEHVWNAFLEVFASILERYSSTLIDPNEDARRWSFSLLQLFLSRFTHSPPQALHTALDNDLRFARLTETIRDLPLPANTRMQYAVWAMRLRARTSAEFASSSLWTMLHNHRLPAEVASDVFDRLSTLASDTLSVYFRRTRRRRIQFETSSDLAHDGERVQPWILDAALILLSNSTELLLSYAYSNLCTFLHDPLRLSAEEEEPITCIAGRLLAGRILHRRADPSERIHIFPISRRLLALLYHSREHAEEQQSCLRNALTLYSTILLHVIGADSGGPPNARSLWNTLQEHPELFYLEDAATIIEDLWTFLYGVLTEFVKRRLAHQLGASGVPDVYRAITEFALHDITRKRSDVVIMWRSLAPTWKVSLHMLTSVHPCTRILDLRDNEALQDLVAEAVVPIEQGDSTVDTSAILDAWLSATADDRLQIDAIRLCQLALLIYVAHRRSDRSFNYYSPIVPPDWPTVWKRLIPHIHRYRRRLISKTHLVRHNVKYWHRRQHIQDTCTGAAHQELIAEDAKLAERCVDLMYTMEEKEATEIFPKQLVDALKCFWQAASLSLLTDGNDNTAAPVDVDGEDTIELGSRKIRAADGSRGASAIHGVGDGSKGRERTVRFADEDNVNRSEQPAAWSARSGRNDTAPPSNVVIRPPLHGASNEGDDKTEPSVRHTHQSSSYSLAVRPSDNRAILEGAMDRDGRGHATVSLTDDPPPDDTMRIDEYTDE